MMNAEKYSELVRQKVFREMEWTFPAGWGIFQQDLASPFHSVKKEKKVFEEKESFEEKKFLKRNLWGYYVNNSLRFLTGQGTNSPDLNPIKNLQSIVKTRLLRNDCTTLTKLIEAIIDVWFRDKKIVQDWQKLVESMPRHVEQLIKNKCGRTAY